MTAPSERQAVAFGSAIIGGVLMVVVPLIPLVYNGPLCLSGSPCSIAPLPWVSAWRSAAGALWLFSGASTIIVALMLRIAESRRRRLIGRALIALSVVYLSVLVIDVIVSESSNMTLDLPGIALARSIGPLLAFLGGFLLVIPQTQGTIADVEASLAGFVP